MALSVGLPNIPCIRSSISMGLVHVATFVVDLIPVAVEVVHIACNCSTVGGANVGCTHMPK